MNTLARPSLIQLADAVSDFAGHAPDDAAVDSVHVRRAYQHEATDGGRIALSVQAPDRDAVGVVADALDLPPLNTEGGLARQGLYAREGGAWLGARYYFVSVYTGAKS